MKHDVAGNPMGSLKWTRKSLAKIIDALSSIGIFISKTTLRKLLKKMDFSLKANQKVIAGGKPQTKKSKALRNQQFLFINKRRDEFVKNGNPTISVDSKKKELIGEFKNQGVKWEREATKVRDHDFRSHAKGIAVPYGVYDVNANKGAVFVGQSHDTPRFAVESIETWWKQEGCKRYPHAKEILILADNGGGNSSRSRAWKYQLQNFCNKSGLNIKVSHYPSGTSKWNPIEHRLFSEISKNWAGEPLISYDKVLNFIRNTKTSTGLEVSAYFMRKKYETGEKISDVEMESLQIKREKFLPKLNYMLKPIM